MKKIIGFLCVVMLFSCKQKEKTDVALEPQVHKEFYGDWVGSFIAEKYKDGKDFSYNNKINLRITSINKNAEVKGQSVVAGHKRLLVGTFNENGNKFVLKESGKEKDKYDGVFEFVIANDTLTGFWKANDTSVIVTERKYVLTKTQFVYNKNLMLPEPEMDDYTDYTKGETKTVKDDSGVDYTRTFYRAASDIILKLNASTTELKEDELKNLKKLELEIIRNTVYARHGYTFNKRSYRQFFDPVDWYVPMYDNVEGSLTKIEQINIALLKRFEKYAADNYDTFGR